MELSTDRILDYRGFSEEDLKGLYDTYHLSIDVSAGAAGNYLYAWLQAMQASGFHI